MELVEEYFCVRCENFVTHQLQANYCMLCVEAVLKELEDE